MILVMVKNANENHLTKQTLLFDQFPKSFNDLTIFFISDIHRRTISDKLLKQLSPTIHLVVIGGDLTEARVPFQRVEHNIKLLKKIAPVYFVYGNNDYEVGQEKLEELLLKHGVTILTNSSAYLQSKSGEKLILLGVEDMSKGKDRLDLAIKHSPKGDFKILISHNPDIYQKIKSTDHISLIMSGHTHGGQIRLFGFGLYTIGKTHFLKNTTHLISNGYGTSGVPLRLGAPAEAHLIQLRHKASSTSSKIEEN
jgi:uncharacterized protein